MLKIARNLTKESLMYKNALPKLSGMVQPSMNFASSKDKFDGPKNLPRLPVPDLDVTLKKLLITARPHLDDVEYATACKSVQDFCQNEGKKLQALLVERAQKHCNWLEDWWMQAAYLEFRAPVVVHSNPGLVFPFRQFAGRRDQLVYAAKTVLAVLQYKRLIDTDAIPTEKWGKNPLDMSQYKKMFGTCRIPGIERDSISFNDSNYITVMHKGHIFHLDVCGEDGVSLNQEQLVCQLEAVVAAAACAAERPVGVLTSEQRDTWGQAYQALCQDERNKCNLVDIERSLFVLCLDEPVGLWSLPSKDCRQTAAAGQTIHGGGAASNGCNRWFDKTVQFIVGADGVTGICYEHTPAEGQPIAVLTDFIMDKVDSEKETDCEASSKVKPPVRLDFDLKQDSAKAICSAKDHLDKMVHDLNIDCFTYGKYGKDFIKSQKLSPDSYLQMAFQYAFYRCHREPGAQYESAATRMFAGGRTETIRSCSVESVAFACAMLDPRASRQDKVAAMKAAIKSHKDYTIMAMQGLGVDRHLLGLKLIAKETGAEIPSIFNEKVITKSAHMRISTSQVACRCDAFMCYGPLVADGYATCYNPRAADVNVAAAAARDPRSDLPSYRAALECALDEMHDLLAATTKAKL